ncbi:hypothetical protein C5167_039202 [Papaver somniferum]|uniref:Uncharacterized protein n=1 Tax=Papaver somniferum TaxID=3469 RepID=A0A4Y7IBF8_PAPSO|nr:uncharacterized protein LOC113304269 [Papaver somniferum]RZC46257.1 hypothetical protein C5167_039202 [Papaver somniferum]
MSKKKAFSGSTMTLKDFHGGSIPSDLPLPSAPGATVTRPSSDRGGYDRQAPWGNPMNRSDHRLRPGSSGTNRNFDDKASFLSHHIHIGRNFDEDERKPLDGISHPRRTISDEVIRAQPTRHEITKLDSVTSTNYSGRQVFNNPMPQSTSGGIHSYRYGESNPVGGNNQMLGGNNSNQGVPNAWGVRKEVGGVNELVHSSSWSEQSAISKFSQASALDKVSRWQNKPVPQFHHHHNQQPDVEVIHYAEPERYSGLNTMIERRGNEAGFDNSVKELPNSERARSPIYPEAKESSSPLYQDMLRPVSTDGKYSGVPKLQPPVSEEVSERRKLKLLPRSKPLEVLEPSIAEHKMGYQQVNDPGHGAAVAELHGNTNVPKLGLAGNEGGGPSVERPKLHLKHRSQIAEQVEETAAKERKSVFGGARPRELVLRERGVDDVVISNLESIQSPNRIKPEVHKIETKAEPARFGERSENVHVDHRAAKDPERKDNRGDNHKTDTQKSSWRKESWRNGNKATEKQQQQEPRPEPETWRKPVEQSNPAPSDGLRYGKAASALELAQAFSRSVSTNPKTPDRISSQKGMAGQPQIPFSRLTATTTTTATREIYSGGTPRRQINGY